jgi:hypothetical protein
VLVVVTAAQIVGIFPILRAYPLQRTAWPDSGEPTLTVSVIEDQYRLSI